MGQKFVENKLGVGRIGLGYDIFRNANLQITLASHSLYLSLDRTYDTLIYFSHSHLPTTLSTS